MNEQPTMTIKMLTDGVEITVRPKREGYTSQDVFVPWRTAGSNDAAVLQQVQAKLTEFFYSM